MPAYYNEFDPNAAAWLRELIACDLIAPGDVDERSICDVSSDDLEGYTQVHLFAGIGVWSYALRLAGIPDHFPIWTGSCPCPPFSSAGKRQRCPQCGSPSNLCHPRRTGHFICLACGCDRYADERHLWPDFSRLVRDRRPAIVLGEQVASRDGRLWFDAVSADLEEAGYGVAGADLCAAGIGAPHIRQRLFFGAYTPRSDAVGMADANPGLAGDRGEPGGPRRAGLQARPVTDGRGEPGWLVDLLGPGLEGHAGDGDDRDQPGRLVADPAGSTAAAGGARGVGDPLGERLLARRDRPDVGHDGAQSGAAREDDRPGPTDGFWRAADWLGCRDGKWRPVEPGTFPLAYGAPARVGRLRGYGNAIVAPLAAEFTAAFIGSIRHLDGLNALLDG